MNATIKIPMYQCVERWESTSCFCPRCGKQPVWKNDAPGDFYLGADYLCLTCGATSYLDSVVMNSDERALATLEQLRAKQGRKL